MFIATVLRHANLLINNRRGSLLPREENHDLYCFHDHGFATDQPNLSKTDLIEKIQLMKFLKWQDFIKKTNPRIHQPQRLFKPSQTRCGLDKSQTVMVGETNKKDNNLVEIEACQNPSWALVETNNILLLWTIFTELF